MKPIVEVKSLWKEYQKGAQKEKYLSLRDSLFKSLKPKAKKESFWALQNINFEVNPGDSLAIIGKNGAGKSTLLKILSKITPPTRGEIVLRGRLASLLEVGTGFHPELTGRENVYLNGSILGLGRQEINRQFDAIVDFSGVEAFLDTPLKHYSSGMQLRLAFAVAAHLEPEILVIDEVLAVGDSTFQQKCIEKMTEVSISGRTLLFVSHNIQAVKSLCKKAILIESGKLIKQGDTDFVVNSYLTNSARSELITRLTNYPRKSGARNLEIEELHLNQNTYNIGDKIEMKLKLQNNSNSRFCDLDFGIALQDHLNNNIIHLSNKFIHQIHNHVSDDSLYTFRFTNYLKTGTYRIALFLRANEEIQDWITDGLHLHVNESNAYNYENSMAIQGIFQPDFEYNVSLNQVTK